MNSIQSTPPSKALSEHFPQLLWNQHGLKVLILWGINVAFTKARYLFVLATNGKERFMREYYTIYKVANLSVFKIGSSPESLRAINQIKRIASETFNLEIGKEITGFIIFSYWLMTLISLYMNRRKGRADNPTLFWRPTFAFSLLLPLIVPMQSYLAWIRYQHSLSDPLVQDYAKIMLGLPKLWMINFSSAAGIFVLVVLICIGWPLSFVVMKWLGTQGRRLGFQ
jgi:hypothetical protein